MATIGLWGDPRVEFFDAVRTPDRGPFLRVGSHGAFLSHLNILRKHVGDGQRVLILQDDCDFLPGAKNAMVPSGWGIFYGGYHQLDPGPLDQSGIQGAHFMAFGPDAIEKLVPFLDGIYAGSIRLSSDRSEKSPGSWIAPPIDGAVVWFRRAFPETQTIFRQLSYQRSSKTDIGDASNIDNYPGFAGLTRFAIRLWRRASVTVSNVRRS